MFQYYHQWLQAPQTSVHKIYDRIIEIGDIGS